MIAAAVADGATTPQAVLAEHVARHRACHDRLNALVQPRHEAAAAEAAAVAATRGIAAAGPLAGVPVSVKECFPVRGLVTPLGIRARRGLVDATDADIVRRLRAAGAVVVGKANVPQAMFLHETDNPVWGSTAHPFAPDRGPGGSSGGDAALVAAGVVPLAVGNDLAGSVRQPAHACGIVGFVPATARLGSGGACRTLPSVTAMTPRVGFLAACVADAVLASTAVGAVDPPPAAATEQNLRIAWWDDAGPIPAAAAIRRGVAEAVGRLARAGVTTREITGAMALEAAWIHLGFMSADGGADLRRLFAGERPIPPVARLLRLAGMPRWIRPLVAAAAQAAGSGIEAAALRHTGPCGSAGLGRLEAARREFAGRFAGELAGCDAIVCPVSALPALRHGTAARLVLAAAPCLLANLLDLPAGTVPVTTVRAEEERPRGRSRDPVLRAADDCDRGSRGLPVGVQVIGLPGAAAGRDPGRVALEVMRLIESHSAGVGRSDAA